MRERPILFSAPMVRAILDGRKTQTRRIVRDGLVVRETAFGVDDAAAFGLRPWPRSAVGPVECPYGAPGDRLWVRETHAQFAVGEGLDRSVPQCVAYRATCDQNGGFDYVNGRGEIMRLKVTKWTPAIHMPRWASRITLNVAGIRVERLQDISEEDARAEGVEATRGHGHPAGDDSLSACEVFRDLWDRINGERAAWASNPWVWVVEFRPATTPPEGT